MYLYEHFKFHNYIYFLSNRKLLRNVYIVSWITLYDSMAVYCIELCTYTRKSIINIVSSLSTAYYFLRNFYTIFITESWFSTDLGDPADSMTLIMASSTSSSPIHNHRQQQNRFNNQAGQYHQGVMTLRRPVVINTQYYGGGGGGGTLQRNNLPQPDVSSANQYRKYNELNDTCMPSILSVT